MMCGGTGAAKPADAEIQSIIEKVKNQVTSKVNISMPKFEAVSYKSQVVAGTNFFIKVKVGEGEYIHLRVFRPLPPNHENYELHGVKTGLGESEEPDYFDSN